jgi:Ca-activated chloride channel homolog
MNSSLPTFGLIAHLEATRICLPLVHVETRFQVTGDWVSVEMDQVFEQNAREALDVTYTFPLPGEASVYRCELHVNGRVVRAVVMEADEARQVVREKKAQGHRTALVEVERDNLFTLELGNAAPGDALRIRFAYVQKLERLADQLSLRLPFCPGIRYIPGKPLLRANRGRGVCDDTDQVPDASRISPPRIGRTHPDAATLYIHGVFAADEVMSDGLSSPSHVVQVFQEPEGLAVELAGEQHVPDRDFILRWQEAPVQQAKPKAWSGTHLEADGRTCRYGLLQVRAPLEQAAVEELEQDVYFLLDRSGSMSGEKWRQCAVALRAFVAELGARDRVWITCFESLFQDFSEVPMTRDELLADEGLQNLEAIGVTGGTELLPALKHVLEMRRKHSGKRPARLILITDGQVGNEDEVLALLNVRTARDLPVHTFGIDTEVNDAFLLQVARQTRGRCALMAPEDDIPAAVRKLAVSLRRPVLTGLQWLDEVATPEEVTALPDLHAGEVLLLPVRVGDASTVSLRASLPDGRPWSVQWQLEDAAVSPLPRLAWVKRRLQHLLTQRHTEQAVALAVQHNVVCRGAAFVAWDEAEKTPIARRAVVQPSLGIDRLEFLATPQRMMSMPMIGISPAKTASVSRDACAFMSSLRDDLDENWDVMDAKPKVDPVVESIRLLLLEFGISEFEQQTLAQVDWTQRFQAVLETRFGLPRAIAEPVAILLRHWADALISASRRRQLDDWLTQLEQPGSEIMLLVQRLAAESHPEVARALTLLQTEWQRARP